MTLPDITIAKKTFVSLLDPGSGNITGEELVNRMLDRNAHGVVLAADGNAASTLAQTLWFVNSNPYPVFFRRATLRCESNVAGAASDIGTINLAMCDGAGGSPANFATINTLNNSFVARIGQAFTITPSPGIMVPAGAGIYYQQTKGASGVAFPIRVLTATVAPA